MLNKILKKMTKKIYYWYTSRALRIGLLGLFLITLAVSVLIPPMQSPDEPAHLNRAYLLSKGIIFTTNEKKINEDSMN